MSLNPTLLCRINVIYSGTSPKTDNTWHNSSVTFPPNRKHIVPPCFNISTPDKLIFNKASFTGPCNSLYYTQTGDMASYLLSQSDNYCLWYMHSYIISPTDPCKFSNVTPHETKFEVRESFVQLSPPLLYPHKSELSLANAPY